MGFASLYPSYALGSAPDEFAAFLRREIPRWKQIVQAAGVKLEGDH
jgi:tripartite-type tricarboxylate transporter receptor subunit TctC